MASLGSTFFDTQTVASDVYLQTVQQNTLDEHPLQIRLAAYFQHDGAWPHFARTVRAYPGRWIGRGGPIQWPPHSPDLTPCDFWLWDMVKERVYSRKVPNINELKDRIQTVVSSIPSEMCVRVLNATVTRWFLSVEYDGEQIETPL
jgi:hypothetical protein